MANADIRRARRLRKIMSPPELALWFRLRALRSGGHHFRRQSPEPPYTLDFVCRRSMLIVEVDGVHHSSEPQTEHDETRDAELVRRGFVILRFWASDVRDELDGVMDAVVAELGPPGVSRPHVMPDMARDRDRPRLRHLVRLGLQRRTSE